MMNAIAATDLHGNTLLYELLLRIVDTWKISSVFLMGDLAPGVPGIADASELARLDAVASQRGYFERVFIPLFESFLGGHRHTHVYAIMGNDDRRVNEPLLQDFSSSVGNFHLVNDRIVRLQESRQIRAFFPTDVPQLAVVGYPYIPLGGGLVMDWVKRENRAGLVPPGMDPCMSIENSGILTVPRTFESTIADDLRDFSSYLGSHEPGAGCAYDPAKTIHLFHAPPYNTPLDQVAPQGYYDFVPLPDHIGSYEIRRFVERTQPYLVLCGHCHEAVVLGDYRTYIGGTCCVNPGSQTHIDVLSLVQFNVFEPSEIKQLFIHAH
jgi:Icc-related predicted phosphoesterase